MLLHVLVWTRGEKNIMKIIINSKRIAENIQSEDALAELSKMDSFYEIRKLKVAVLLNGLDIEITKMNDYAQVFIDEFDIWINSNEYKIVY